MSQKQHPGDEAAQPRMDPGLLRKQILIVIALLLAAPLGVRASDSSEPTDLRGLAAGETLALGTLREGACEYAPFMASVMVSPETPFFAFEVKNLDSCELVLTSVCEDPLACPEAFVDGALPEAGPLEFPRTHCTATKRVKADYWTEGYPGTSWDGSKDDMLAYTYVDMTWDHNCSDGNPVVAGISADCQPDAPDWHRHWCQNTSLCNYQANSVCWELEGEFECHFDINFFCSGSTYLHKIHAAVRGRNDGTAECQYRHTGTLPPEVDGTCYWMTP